MAPRSRHRTALAALVLGLASCGEAEPPLPSLAFVAPTALVTADSSVEIALSFSDADAADVWSVAYVSAAATPRGATIGSGVVGDGAASLVWSTADLPNGAYYLTAELTSGERTALATADGFVDVNHALPGNTLPVVTLLSPNGGEVLVMGATSTITWRGSDADGDALTYTLEYTANGGGTWLPLASGVTAASYDWIIPTTAVPGSAYRVRITVADTKGGSLSDVSDREFTVKRPLTWANSIRTIVVPSCASAACHATGGVEGVDFVADVYTNDAGTGAFQRRDRLWARIIDGSMPPAGSGYPVISALNQARIKEWLDNGAPP